MNNDEQPQQAAPAVATFQLCEGMRAALMPEQWMPGMVIRHSHFDGHNEADAVAISYALTWHQVRWPWFGKPETCADCAAGKFRDPCLHWHGCELCISAMMARACTICVHLMAVGQPQLRCEVLTSYAEFATKMGWPLIKEEGENNG